MLKPCSCGREGCTVMAPQDGHAWDPLAAPADDCILCERPFMPADVAVAHGSGYAHAECAERYE